MFHPEFLAHCGAGTRRVYDYWESKRAARIAPTRADIDPADLKSVLPGLVIVDVVRFPDQLVYRLVGTGAVDMRGGSNPTGKTVAEGYHGRDQAEVLENYRLVIEEHRVVYDCDNTPTKYDDYFEQSEAILMPLSADGARVNQVLVYSEVRRRNG